MLAVDQIFFATSIANNTFVCAGGGSIIYTIVVSNPLFDVMGEPSVDVQTELFTGAPSRGHLPAMTELCMSSWSDSL